MKTCTKCKETKPLDRFNKDESRKDGLNYCCKDCRNVIVRRSAADPSYRAKVSARMKRYNADPINKARLVIHRSIPINKIKRADSNATWSRANPDKRKASKGKYRAQKRGNTIEPLPDNWWESLLDLYGAACMKCGGTQNLTHDHVVPVSLGGPEAMSNFQILCDTCNKSKGNRSCVDYRNGVIYGME